MSDIPSASGRLSDDVPVDVTVSYPKGAGRFKLHFRNSKPLIETLIAWTRAGHTDIRLTWGNTSPESREGIERTLAAENVQYTVPVTTDNETPPTRASLLLGGLGVVAALAFGVYFLTKKVDDVNMGLNNLAAVERAREEQNRRAAGRALEGVQARAFRELEDADPAVRLEAVARVGQLYAADPRAVPALAKRLKDDDRRVRLAAIAVLGNAGANAEEATRALKSLLDDPDEAVRKAAEAALAKLK